jgi:hypothetical protein
MRIKTWVEGCVAGVVFVLGYNLLYLHTSVIYALIKTLVIASEANLLLIVYLKIRELIV